ncbi:MAG: transcription termination/antitermination factor NusG [Clostridia bacterium]|nr:transcription termination/antitermination factor NusG [Clostridia bacterium]
MSEKTPLWYVVHTYSGYENKVKDNLEKSVENNPKLRNTIFEVRIPTEITYEIKNGRRREVEHKLLPGYVMVNMIMDNETWYIVRNTRGVTGFVGPGSKPTPLSEEDILKLAQAHEPPQVDIAVGDEVNILSGMFENFTGRVTEMDQYTGTVKVAVTMMHRETVISLTFDEVKRVDND